MDFITVISDFDSTTANQVSIKWISESAQFLPSSGKFRTTQKYTTSTSLIEYGRSGASNPFNYVLI